MKKLLIVLLIFLSCGGSNTTQETVENSTTTTTSSLFQPATTIYKFKSLAKYGYTLEEIDGEYCIFFLEYKSDPFQCFEDESEAIEDFKFRAGLEEYRQGWEKELVDYPNLTEEEYNKSREFLDHKNVWNIYMTIEGKEYECNIKNRGMTIDIFANENHPINVYENNVVQSYMINADYTCSEINGDEGMFLYGPIFYQDNQWWGFIEYEEDYWEDQDRPSVYGFMTRFSKRTSLGDSLLEDHVERLENSTDPQITISNCPKDPIKETSFELFWNIIAGNSDIDYVFIVFNKDGEYHTRAFFEKVFNADIFPFPLANTVGEFGQLVDNTDETGTTTYLVSFSVSDVLNNSADNSCEITFDN